MARMGGDEYACLIRGDQSRSAVRLAERLIASFNEPIVLDTFTAQVGASAGVYSRTGGAHPDPTSSYECADYVLFEAKRAGRGQVKVFNGTHEHSMRRETKIRHLLGLADLDAEMTPVFQPIVDARSLKLRAFETLVRWNSPELGLVGPQEFISLVERTDLIFDLSRCVFRAALDRAASWPDHVGLKVNLSIRDLMSSRQTAALLDQLSASTIDPGRVTFEITETILAESLEHVRSSVDVIRGAGCRIAIDDFGVGYSSLNYIHALAPDVIKIDRCFINEIETNEVTRRVVRTIIELARNVGAASVAEGVETARQAAILADLGCDELQGYYLSKPVGGDISSDLARRDAFGPERAAICPLSLA